MPTMTKILLQFARNELARIQDQAVEPGSGYGPPACRPIAEVS
jgi:hypothetical protein